MSKTTIVRYTTRPEAADENQRLVERVFAQLAAEEPGALRYAVFRLADGVSFVHIAVVEGEASPLSQLTAFAEYVQGIGERTAEPPQVSDATLVGSYGVSVVGPVANLSDGTLVG